MTSWIIILTGLGSTWRFMDIQSDNGFYGVFLPILFGFFVLALVVKLIGGAGSGRGGGGGWHDGGSFGGGDSGGDSGGGGD